MLMCAFPSFEVCGQLMLMPSAFIEKNNRSPPSLWHTDASYSALATIHFPNTSSILVIIRSAHWMLAEINLSVRGLLLCPSIGHGISEAKWIRYGTQQRWYRSNVCALPVRLNLEYISVMNITCGN